MTTNKACETKVKHIKLKNINNVLLKIAETEDEEYEWRYNYAERKYDKVVKGSSYKQEHLPLGRFGSKYGGFPSPPRF